MRQGQNWNRYYRTDHKPFQEAFYGMPGMLIVFSMLIMSFMMVLMLPVPTVIMGSCRMFIMLMLHGFYCRIIKPGYAGTYQLGEDKSFNDANTRFPKGNVYTDNSGYIQAV